jgi:hypothetical protein
MVIAGLFGYSGHTWTMTIGLLFVFAVIFPVLIQGLIAFAIAQGKGEKRDNIKHAGRWGRPPAEDE